MKKLKTTQKAGLIAFIAVLVLLVIYIGVSLFYTNRFYPNSTVNGVNSSSAKLDKVKEGIREQARDYEITIIERSKNVSTLTSEEVGLSVDTETGAIDDLLAGQNGFAWPAALFEPTDYVSEAIVSVDRKVLEDSVSGLPCLMDSHQSKTQDATFAFSDGKFVVVEEVYGTELNKSDLVDHLYDAIMSLQPSLDLEAQKVYVQPKVLSDDKELNAKIEKLNESLNMTVTYDNGDVVNADNIQEWISVDDAGNVVYDEEAIAAFVEDMAERTDTVGKSRAFSATGGTVVTVDGGSYGWKIDVQAETEHLINDLKSGKSVEREPVYEHTAASHGDNDYGNSYVEVDISRQHVWLYVDGGLVTQTDCVTGNLMRNLGTHTGTYFVEYKQQNRVLNGGEESVEVKYWMPFNGGEGLHDAWWKKSFGGDQYIEDGSHGCVNLPSSQAKIIYENVDAGFPVIIYASSGNYNPAPNPNAPAVNSIIEVLKDLKGVNETNYVQIIQMMDLYNTLPPESQEQVVYKKRFFNGYNVALQYAERLGMPETPVEDAATGEVVTEQSAAENGAPEEGTM